MAEALIKGLVKASFIYPENILASDVREDRLKSLAELYKISVADTNQEAAKHTDIIILSVKPQVMEKVLKGIKDAVDRSKLVVSIAAGISISKIKGILGEDTRIIRAMPNTPALIQSGATAVSRCENTSDDDVKIALKIFNAVGITVTVDEELMDAVTGLSGSGPAYIFLIIEALADAGVKMGLSRSIAMKLSVQTVLGAAKLVSETGRHPGELKDMVTSPGGTAISGLHTLEEGGLRTTLINAVEAATKRSKELAGC